MGSLVQAHPEAPGRKTPACLPSFFYPLHDEPQQCRPTAPHTPPTRRATAMPPPPPLFPHIVGSRHGATEPPMRTAPSRRAEQCRTPRAERAACRRYAIMVSPTQSVPEVLAVWGSDYKKAIVCRRYTIMVAQSPPQPPHITNHHHKQSPHPRHPLQRPTKK